PSSLCSFCDEKLPLSPSARLTALREELELKSRPCPIPGNAGHRETSVTNFVAYCELHRVERNILPVALARGWPLSPDFGTLFDRVTRLKNALTIICEEPDNSSFFRTAKD
ncbi:hypothetical protein B0H13DRAFT_1564417, partial [Mycena leptocephala]